MVCGGGNGNLTLGILRLNDRKSRHRRIKKQRRYERLAATQASYPCGNFSDTSKIKRIDRPRFRGLYSY